MLLTELEKTILISLYALTQSLKSKSLSEGELLSKFPVRQRKAVKKYLQELVRKKLLKRETDKRKILMYKITDRAVSEATKIIISGARLRF